MLAITHFAQVHYSLKYQKARGSATSVLNAKYVDFNVLLGHGLLIGHTVELAMCQKLHLEEEIRHLLLHMLLHHY